jgi:subtilase family serine protease
MKPFTLLVVAAAVLVLAVPSAMASRAQAGTGFGSEHACKTGQMRCGALILTKDGRRVTAATPFVLPAGYGPAQYHGAYNLPTTTSGKVTVSIVDAFDDKTIFADLKKYSTTFGIPVLPQCTSTVTTSCFKKMNLGAPPGSAVAPGWDVEIALDVETVHAICQNCKIVLVEAINASFAHLEAAVNAASKQGKIISNSYGAYGFDGSSPPDDSAYNHPKEAVVVSAGDDGYGVSYPAGLNTVISVGGTRLTLGAGNTYGSERTWGPASTPGFGTGSGCANGAVSGAPSVPARSFQSGVAGYAATGCGTVRGDNDVAANADPNTGSAVFATSQGWIQVGGTSLSAPLIAGVIALKNDFASATYPASILYAHAGTAAFHDVTTGSDDAGNWPLPCTHTSACHAVAGYDLPTGVGTPHGIGGF